MADEVFHQFEDFDFETNNEFQVGWKSISERLGDAVSARTLLTAKVFFFSKNVAPVDLNQYLLWQKEKGESEKKDGVIEESSLIQQDSLFSKKHSSTSQTQQLIPKPIHECSRVSHITNTVTDERMMSSRLTGLSLKAQSGHTAAETVSGSDNITAESAPGPDLDLKSRETDCDASKTTHDSSESLCNNICGAHIVSNYTESDTLSSEVRSSVIASNSSHDDQPALSLAEVAELIQKNLPIPGVKTLDVKPTNSCPTPSVMERKAKPWQDGQTLDVRLDSDSL